jgi:dihydroorotate dehydrogenase (fumarate)
MHSLFEEQIAHESKVLDHYLEYGSESFAEALSYFPQAEDYRVGPEKYLEHIEEARKAVDVPIIGSLNGVTTGGWIEYARRIQDAGADALELNIYHIPVDPEADAVQVEQLYVDIVSAVTSRVGIPVAVKIGPFFSAPVNMARKLVAAGAAGLVIFNRFYQPDFDLENLEVEPKLVLSDSHELRLPLRWAAIMHSHVDADIAITSGVHNSYDVLKCMLAGAKVAMTTSELLQHGIGRIKEIRDAVEQWLEENEYESLQQMQGSMSQKHVPHPEAFERANYQKALQSWKPDPLGSMRERP